MLEKLSSNPKQIFLIDGLGAILSTFLYLAVLANFESVFGMPQKTIYFLGFLAGLYAIYSLCCYLKNLKNWQFYLKIIALANFFHCCLTFGLVIHYYQQLTIWGLLYFAGEIIIVMTLATYEFKTASNPKSGYR